MARPGVTYLEVANAAQQLIASGKSPTIEMIRIALGTGSNSTLGSHLRTWKAKQDQTQQIATKEKIPEELIAALKGVWDRVMNQSEEQIQTIQIAAEQEVTTFKQEVERLQKENVNWQQQYQQTKQERDSLAHDKTTLEQLLTDSKTEIAVLIEKQTGLEQQHVQKQERIDELRRQYQQVQANLEHYRNASLEQRLADQQRYEQQQQQLEYTIQQLNQELIKLRQEKLAHEQQYHQLMFENESLAKQVEKLDKQHETLSKRLAEMLTELAKKTQDENRWQEQCQAIQTKYDEQNQVFIDIKTQHAMLAQQVDNMKIELNELREQNKALGHEKWILGQEKAQLYGQLKQLESSTS